MNWADAVSVTIDSATILYVLTRSKGKSPYRPPSSPDPVCGCEHHHSFHDPRTGVCAGTNRVASEWGWRQNYHGTNERVAMAYIDQPCTCRHYVGPIPMPMMYDTPMTDQVAYEPAPEARTATDGHTGLTKAH